MTGGRESYSILELSGDVRFSILLIDAKISEGSA